MGRCWVLSVKFSVHYEKDLLRFFASSFLFHLNLSLNLECLVKAFQSLGPTGSMVEMRPFFRRPEQDEWFVSSSFFLSTLFVSFRFVCSNVEASFA